MSKQSVPVPTIFSFNLIELTLATLIGIGMVFSFRYVLWSAAPWSWQFHPSSDSYPAWFIHDRNELFRDFGWFMFVLGFVATVCLVRSLRRQIHFIPFVGYVSPLGYIALVWPLFLLIPQLHMLFVFLHFVGLAGIPD